MESQNFHDAVREVSMNLQPCLHRLKEEYASVINSRRRLSLLTNFYDLVKLLIKRDFFNVEGKEGECFVWLGDVCQRYLHRKPSDSQSIIQQASVPPPSDPTYHGPVFPRLHPKIVEHISKHVGHYRWRALARDLDIPDRFINRVEIENGNDPPSCVRKVLEMYMEYMPVPTPGGIVEKLSTALDLLGRTDLRRDITKIAQSFQDTSSAR